MVSVNAAGRVLKDIVLDVLLFPVYWYSKGLLRMVTWAGESLLGALTSLSLGVWIKNLFVPMYGQRDWQSRLISIFMRSVQIIFRLLGFFFWAIIVLVALALYVAAPVFLIGFALYHGLGSLAS
jgi:hypothetical protein